MAYTYQNMEGMKKIIKKRNEKFTYKNKEEMIDYHNSGEFTLIFIIIGYFWNGNAAPYGTGQTAREGATADNAPSVQLT